MSQRNLEKRKDLVEKWGTNYFRDFKNIRKYRSGKTFMANPGIFKKEAALYFPNFHGDTLAGKNEDTTNVLQGKVSVVNVYSSQWGLSQVETFTGKPKNPELHNILSQNPEVAQMVDVNIEENSMKAWIIALFQWRLKASKPKEDWGRYFVVRKGVSERIRETIGLLNGRVGYVYLVDQDCKIRWAGSGDAEGTEVEDMNRGLTRLVSEAKQFSQ
jgi:ATPase complex subunit ATP10